MTTKSFSTVGQKLQSYASGVLWSERFRPGTSGTMETFDHNLQRLGVVDVGGPWYAVKTSIEDVPGKYVYGNGANVTDTVPTIPSLVSAPFSTLKTSDSEMNSMGASLLSLADPTEPVFSAATALGELRNDGIPSLPGLESWRSRSLSAKRAGGEYLNVEFGWKPLVADILKLAKAVKDADQIVGQYRARANTKHHFLTGDNAPRVTSNEVFLVKDAAVSHSSGHGAISILHCDGQGLALTLERKWVEGVYKYYLPMGDDVLSQMRRYGSYARKLYGIELTPEVVWNLSPWSWAADWFGNVGDLAHNVSAFGRDSFALQYCYVMHEKTYIREFKTNYGTARTVVTRKQRRPASPYGFGVALESLSKRQMAILVALGLSHGNGIPRG